jgi:subtilisin family serine protease
MFLIFSKTSLKCGLVFTLLALSFLPSNSHATDSDSLRTKESFELIGLDTLHKQGITGKDQVIVFIDDGVQTNHPIIKEAMIDGFCSSNAVCGEFYLKSGIEAGEIRGDSTSPHGLMVAGTIAGRAVEGTLGGIAPKAKLISINNTNGNNSGLYAAFDWILEAKKKYNIVAVSGSFAGPNVGRRDSIGACSGADDLLVMKIRNVYDAGIVPIFATANDGNALRNSFPACLDFVFAVGATDSRGNLQSYSNVGPNLTVLAPSDVKTAGINGTTFLGGGTSNATPVVAGAVALLKQAKPEATIVDLRKAIQSSTRFVDDILWKGLPILDLPTALNAIKTGNYSISKITQARIDYAVDMDAANTARVKAEADAKLAKDAQAKAEADAKLAKDAQAKAEADAKLAKDAQAKAEADAKLAKDAQAKAEADAKLAKDAQAKAEADAKQITITCVKGKLIKKVTGVKPICPPGYKKK